MISKLSLFTFAVTLSSSALASQSAQIIGAEVWGRDCPRGAFSTVLGSNFAEVSYDRLKIGLHRSSYQMEKNCKIQLQVRVPSGFTLGELNLEVDGYYNLPGRQATATLLTDLTTRGLTYGSTVKQSGLMINERRPHQKSFKAGVKFADIGDINASECHRDRTVLLTVDTRAVVRHRGRPSNHSWFYINKIRYSLPLVNGSILTSCAGNDWEDDVLGDL